MKFFPNLQYFHVFINSKCNNINRKKFFNVIKTRNTFKGQLGFNTNHQPSTTPSKHTASGAGVAKIPNKNSFNNENNDLDLNSEFGNHSPILDEKFVHRKHRYHI